ncbi:uncharacterized protein LOC106069044 isoform X3 [Biomphalaria glabrata]|uniref:Uncharacterized protein LOC106069044 isoform X3 n=1 Tax=Biomphalaria glabrata TaxID=6526 RepID=A0A9W2ZA11_BIOGL|nr:uncharacterized protein LOC106069044 isoform X3 [Biomphalaria glabrata]KAI8736902.1 hypothetical protein BgiMline_026056 [Biomphalaria glabrata]KAI8776918.1 hypothetical protein BgiBS90_022666 [Biomphalaria glabrata]
MAAPNEISRKDQFQAYAMVPGLSYIPDKIEVAENPALIHKIQTEFLEFLICLTDTLKLLHLIKPKHLRCMNPIPQSVLREMRVFGNKGPLYKKFDKHTGGAIVGISASADNLFRKGMSTASGFVNKTKPVLKKEGIKKKPLESDLIEIIGKRTKPLWHSVALDRNQEQNMTQLLEEKLDDPKAESSQIKLQRDIINKKNIPVTRTRSETLVIAIKYLMQTNIRPNDEEFQRQMDMMAASDAGFKSVEEYKIYLETLRPHWYKDLLKSCIHIGIYTAKEIMEAFEDLGYFYNMNEASLNLAKAKLSYLVLSLPIWDIGRMEVQRVIDFILYEILKEAKNKNILEEWLVVRKLPYVVMPAIQSDELIAMREAQQQTQQVEQPVHPQSDNMSTGNGSIYD